MEEEKKASQGAGLKKLWTLCANGHKHYYDCGVVIYPPPIVCVECGATVMKSGEDVCGEG